MIDRKAYLRNWRRENSAHTRAYERRRKRAKADNHLRRTYGIDTVQRDAMLTRQKGCSGCRRIVPGHRGWVVDHCHTTGKIRGILCHNCNSALGHAKDKPSTLRRLARYLESNS